MSESTAQANRIYQSLGHFFVEFSRIVQMMEVGILFATGGNQLLVRALVAELTADPLTRAWRSVMVQAPANLSAEDQEVLSGLVAEITMLINLRNDWSHGVWFVGHKSLTTGDWSEAGLSRFKNSAKGLAAPSKLERSPTAEYVDKAAAHAAMVAKAIFAYGLTVSARLDERPTSVHPSDRVRIVKTGSRRQVQVSENGSDWRSSEWV